MDIMSAAVGADVESICSKCGDVWHVVVAKVGEQIARVQCKQCGGYHRYKPPGGKAVSTRSRSASATPRRAGTPRAVTRIDKPLVEPDMSRPARAYNAKESYQPGDRVEHPKFGLGVVEITTEPGKMQVLFSEGRRVLALAKQTTTLEKPQSFWHNGNDGGKPPL
jgi:hypothetical protein